MYLKQLSVFLENKPGKLESILKVLSEGGINMLTLTIAELSDFGIVRMIVNKPEEAKKLLKEKHITCSTTNVLAIAIDDTPGSLLKAIDMFKERNLNIEYMYAFTEKKGDKAIMIFRFEDAELAAKTLVEEGYDVMKNIDIIGE